MLEYINTPQDIKRFSDEQISALADEIRESIIAQVSRTGGHLASNLGAVELTIALHRTFDCPKDKLLFDVGHQCYAHKLLTGRFSKFHSLRQFGGMSGFTNRLESEYDTVIAGHSGPTLSASLGIAHANRMSGDDSFVVCVIGDGSFTNGMVYEAINNCEDENLNLVIVLNDNEMSISQNVGALSRYFRKIRNTKGYFSLKAGMKDFFGKIPFVGKSLVKGITSLKNFLKRRVLKNNLFECLGLEYIGPVDGHDERKLELALKEAKSKHRITLVHVMTTKGKGCSFAEDSPEKYHGISPFDKCTGQTCERGESFSSHFGKILEQHALKDDKLCAVTAAMCEGTGLCGFREKYPSRFFDVGIAEEHAVTFSSGLSLKGYHPVCVLYSTFAQRTFDQVMHDVSIQQIPLVIALDRAGIVPGDGITHQGVFDISLFSSLPEIEIYSPETFLELDEAMDNALSNYSGVKVIRYPKGCDPDYFVDAVSNAEFTYTKEPNPEVIAITYGRLSKRVYAAAQKSKRRVKVIKLKKIFPIDSRSLSELFNGCKKVAVFEETMRQGGIGEKLASALSKDGIRVITLAIDEYIPHGDADSLYDMLGFSVENICDIIINCAESE
ncbi:MAG: 1-deoxy-D-xylulose-5-phosphate synthase [Lachnospiraceae bacterium]